MAAQAWKLYNKAIKKIGNSTINLGTGQVRCALVKSTSNFATTTLSLLGSLTNQLTEQFGYSSSGKALTGEAWTVGTSASQYKFDANDPVWCAAGGNITSILGAVLFMSGAAAGSCHLLAYASLTSSVFTLSSGNSLTLQFNSAGIFTVANA
jgi:hypothetical protein